MKRWLASKSGPEGSYSRFIFVLLPDGRVYTSVWLQVWHKGFRVRWSSGRFPTFHFFDMRGLKCSLCGEWHPADQDLFTHLAPTQ